MLRRNLTPSVAESLTDRPVVAVVGPRQAGKSTLALDLVRQGLLHRYHTLDDPVTFAAAKSDPAGFVAALEPGTVIDEVQRAPGLARAIKLAVDFDRRPGRFLLTGSAQLMALPTLADALVGRMDVLTLRPLSQGEISGTVDGFVDWAFGTGAAPDVAGISRADLIDRIAAGGFPEPWNWRSSRRDAWYRSYVATLIQRDVRELADITGTVDLQRLLTMLSARTASLLNTAELSRTTGLPQTTLRRYLALLDGTFLVETLPAWTGDPGRRLAKAPKVHLVDSGLAAWLTAGDHGRLAREPERWGALLESFVVGEVRKQLGWSSIDARLSHYRSHDDREVDLVLEARDGRLVGIEVKATVSPDARDLRGLHAFRERNPGRFHRGIVLYLGRQSVPLGDRLYALPIDALWQTVE
jgi:predicted AAA+ superfamily ATPase